MKLSKKISVYSNIIYELSLENRDVNNYISRSQKVLQAIDLDEFKPLNKILENLSFDVDDKLNIIDSVFKKLVNKEMLNFIKILVKRNEFNLVYQIMINYISLASKEVNSKFGKVYSIRNLEDSEMKKLVDLLSKKFSSKIYLENIIDPSLIGGIKIVFDNLVIDKSLKFKISDLKNDLKK